MEGNNNMSLFNRNPEKHKFDSRTPVGLTARGREMVEASMRNDPAFLIMSHLADNGNVTASQLAETLGDADTKKVEIILKRLIKQGLVRVSSEGEQ